ncbi:MAG TPA: UDP-N-acetylglucosamine 1-carboxyvinyltransferase [Candidatus Paceibacterota bacterium]|nr:UDP-N-acetylglucosamine 1-carboxyvinyltransferase [Candidatus Paceibacterota bacterium]
MNPKQSFHITGLAGEKTLKGSVSIQGAKNAALKAMAAAILFDGPVTLENIPDNADVATMTEVLTKLGAKAQWVEDGDLSIFTIDATGISSTDIDPTLAGSMRASVVLTGPLLARFGRVSFPTPGGCVIGARPIDLFIDGYKKMGAKIDEDKNSYYITAPDKLHETEIFFSKQTVGGTETLMMAAVLSSGTTILKNCAMEPEIVNVAEWLNACGADIRGVGTPTIEITGTGGKLLSAKKHPYVTIPDRIETGSYLLLGALCAQDMSITDCEPKHVESLINLLRDSGVPLVIEPTTIKIVNNVAPTSLLTPVADIRTHEYPGFPTDLQAPLVTYLTQTNGQSKVFETIYEGRYKYVEDLNTIGAGISFLNPREISINGPTPFKALPDGSTLEARDIRAGFAVVMAALAGKGQFTITNIHLIDRGYEKLEQRLQKLGAKIERKTL